MFGFCRHCSSFRMEQKESIYVNLIRALPEYERQSEHTIFFLLLFCFNIGFCCSHIIFFRQFHFACVCMCVCVFVWAFLEEKKNEKCLCMRISSLSYMYCNTRTSIENAHTLKVNEQQHFLVDAFVVVVELILKRKKKQRKNNTHRFWVNWTVAVSAVSSQQTRNVQTRERKKNITLDAYYRWAFIVIFDNLMVSLWK